MDSFQALQFRDHFRLGQVHCRKNIAAALPVPGYRASHRDRGHSPVAHPQRPSDVISRCLERTGGTVVRGRDGVVGRGMSLRDDQLQEFRIEA